MEGSGAASRRYGCPACGGGLRYDIASHKMCCDLCGTQTDLDRIPEALQAGCGYDAPGSFAAWLSYQTPMHAWKMTGSRHDIGDLKSYEAVKDTYQGPIR